MSGQSLFENPITVNSDSCVIEQNNLVKTGRTKFNDIFRNVVTHEEATILSKQAFSDDVELIDYHLRSYSEEKLGFLGAHLCLVLVVRDPGSNEYKKQNFFVKTIPYDVPSQAAYIEEKGCFAKESAFFRFLVPFLTENYKGCAWAPTCYLVKDNTLVFEDMKYKGFINRSRMLDEKSIIAAVSCIARLHACSLLAEERLNGKTFDEVYPEILEETEFKRTGRSYSWYANAINLAVDVAQDLELDSSCIRRASERIFDICEPSKNKRNVISHGDLWSSNMIFDDFGNCNLVDFQLVRYAPLAHDLMQLIYLTTTREFRNKHESRILKHYYTILKETLANNNFKGIVPNFQELLQGVKEQRLPALVTAVIFHPTVLMDGKTAANIMDNPETYESYYFNNRKPFVDEIMAKDSDYKARITEGVRELVEMSLIVDTLPRPS